MTDEPTTDLFDRAAREIGDLAARRKQWRMCIPVQRDDSDIVLMTAVQAGREATNKYGGLLTFIAATKHAWDRVGECEEEFEGDAPGVCVEWRDMLDSALIRLFQAVCSHTEYDDLGFCNSCGVKKEPSDA